VIASKGKRGTYLKKGGHARRPLSCPDDHSQRSAQMVIGHLSVAYLARARWPRTEIVALLVASILPDLADFVLPQGNQCRTACGMYTHAFPAFLVLGAAASALAWFIWHRRATAVLVFVMVVLHVALDFFTGHKPFWYGGPPMGLSLFDHHVLDFAIEAAMGTAGWWLLRRTAAPPRLAISVAALAVLLALQAGFDIWMHLGRPG
jgi:hypothetical protein